ncbi:MAG TPA: tripartite tricarboxylate transporter substrate-binding protein, partial [Candidatus Binatia bacterium]|nr:tripartite tricarboxylate transporter substrate-binding protein [Candidatus Binatia bacterium]
MTNNQSPAILPRSRWVHFLSVLLVQFFALIAESPAQEKYPNRPITIVAPFPPGGVADLTARPVAAAMEKVLKNPVVVVNKTGAAGAVGMSFVANSKPDGYNLLMALSSISIIPEADKLFDRKPAYTMDQLIPIALISADPTIFVVSASRPWKNVKEFVEDAKKRPADIS